MLGASVIPVNSGTKTLKDATNEAMRDWLQNVEHTHYIIGSVVGPHPFPMIVRDFQKVIGVETMHQLKELKQNLPDYLVACVGGGSNAIGLFYPFINFEQVKMFGVEAAGKGIPTGEHAATLLMGEIGIFHGMRSYLLQDKDGYVQPPYSISAGLDYPGVGPEHSFLKDSGRVKYASVTDDQAIAASFLLSRLEGIIPALESAHAIAYLDELLPETSPEEVVIINLSGRGDKDMSIFTRYLEEEYQKTEAVSQ